MSGWVYCGARWADFDAEPGMLIEVDDPDTFDHVTNEPGKTVTRKQYLVGHINTLAGECDDCRANFASANAIVIRYKRVWEPKK